MPDVRPRGELLRGVPSRGVAPPSQPLVSLPVPKLPTAFFCLPTCDAIVCCETSYDPASGASGAAFFSNSRGPEEAKAEDAIERRWWLDATKKEIGRAHV